MFPTIDVLLQQRILAFFIAAAIGSAISWIAWNNGYYRIPPRTHATSHITWLHVFGAFALFLGMEIVIVPSLYFLWLGVKHPNEPIPATVHLDSETQGWINLIAMFVTTLVLLVYFFQLKKNDRQQIWGDGGKGSPIVNFLSNWTLGAITWLIVYPWIIVLSQLIGIVEEFSYQGPHIDQVAVKHLKDALTHPILLFLTTFAVVTIVPCLEELIFRGFLQTWLKGLYGTTYAILFTSIIFAAFHYSSTQGIENIELLLALFVLSCFLGFIRERQNSLWASIGLHSTFNGISMLMIFLGE